MRGVVLLILSACFHDPPPSAAPLVQQRAIHHDDVPTTSDGANTLSVTAIAPSNGDVDGGTYVRITGAHFIADGPRNVKIYFGPRQGAFVRFVSDTELIAEAPGGRPDEIVDVLIVFEPGGEMKLPRAFKFFEKP